MEWRNASARDEFGKSRRSVAFEKTEMVTVMVTGAIRNLMGIFLTALF
jgi:hypothetical protein